MIETYELGEVLRSARPIMDEIITDYAKKNDKFCLVSPDMTRAAFPTFMEKCQSQHFNVGIAETEAIDMASGLALEGFLPYVYGMSAFLTMRSFEAIRTNVCYQNHNVKFIGCNTGVSLGMLGSTHYAMEDMSLLTSIPNMTVICPGDPDQTIKAFYAANEMEGPVYIRMANGKVESAVYKEDYEFKIGKGITIMDGDDCAIIACGVMVSYAVDAAKKLRKEGINVTVIDMHTIKPIDEELILKVAAKTGKIVTVEDHFKSCGMGMKVCGVVAESGIPCKVKRLGIPDMYPGFGTFTDMLNNLGYGSDGIIASVKAML
ncbi:MAG: transketolase C-terminal domain-containing protein [Acutalibacteraceae bacterium]|nr:transketolase C-terminal domain-containing protein [Acutalibacteraceae bacterium]